ncbi:MAG: potassium-transporting ATPase subunit F [Bacteroidota bacterium]
MGASVAYVLGALVALLILGYLLFSLFKPENF